MPWFLVLSACASCFELPGENEQPEESPPPAADSGEEAEGDTAEDTGELPLPDRCDQPHEDDENFGNDYSQPIVLPLDTWSCGTIDAVNDVEYFTFTTTEPGWMKIDAQAELRGSSANLYSLISFLSGEDAVTTHGRSYGSDPLTVFFAPTAGDYLVTLAESSGGYGDAYGWWMVVSMSKAPVEFDLVESEPNDDRSLATAFAPEVQLDGEGEPTDPGVAAVSYYATIGDAGDADWWIVNLPEGADQFVLDVDSFVLGAPTDIQLTLYWTDDTGALDFFDEEGTDQDGSVEDPWGEYDVATIRAQGAADYPERTDFNQIAVRTTNWEGTDGSMFHWYTLTLTTTDLEKSE